MYLPPFNAFLQNMGISAAEFETSTKVRVPTELLKFLLQLAISNSDFNEKGYLAANSDVADTVRRGGIGSAKLHYLGYGFFEGRYGATPEVDEKWYRSTYPDIDQSIKAGKISSATEHFQTTGAGEGRSPNAASLTDANQWKAVFEK
jgi:hypothetical protein